MFFLNVSSLLFNNLSILLKMYLEGHVMVTNTTFLIYIYKVWVSISGTVFSEFLKFTAQSLQTHYEAQA